MDMCINRIFTIIATQCIVDYIYGRLRGLLFLPFQKMSLRRLTRLTLTTSSMGTSLQTISTADGSTVGSP